MKDALHCIAKKHDGYWSARCLDFTLYAVGDTFDEARKKLHFQINEYVHDALAGEDREYGPELLLRRAPLWDWIQFYAIAFLQRCVAIRERLGSTFQENIPHGEPYRHA